MKPSKSWLDKLPYSLRGTTGGTKKERPKLSDNRSDRNPSFDDNGGGAVTPVVGGMPGRRATTAVVDVGGMIDVSTLSPKEVESYFERMLTDMNLKEEKKIPLRQFDMVQKRNLLQQNIRTQLDGQLDEPDYYLRLLSREHLSGRELETLRVKLTSCTVSWMSMFKPRGLPLMLEHLKRVSLSLDPQYRRSIADTDSPMDSLECLQTEQHELVKCLLAVLNIASGLALFFGTDGSFNTLVQSINITNQNCMALVIRTLACVAVIDDDSLKGLSYTEGVDMNGHERVLNALTEVAELKGMERFVPVVMGLHEPQFPSLQSACMQLINCILNHDDLDFRVMLRSELMRVGMRDIIDDLEHTHFEELSRHVKRFLDKQDDDCDELLKRFDGIRVDLENPQECFDVVKSMVAETPAEPYLLSMLQHLLCIRDDALARPAYFMLIEEMISRIVLYRDGCDPDFRRHRRFDDLDVENILDHIVSAFNDGGDGGVMLRSVNRQLEATTIARHEAQSVLSQYVQKTEEYQKEIVALREHISSAGKTPMPKPTAADLPPPNLVFEPLPITTAHPPTAPTSSKIPPPPPLPPGGLGGGPPPPPPPPLPAGGFGKGIPPPPPLPPGSGPPPPPPLPPGGLGGGPPPPPPLMGMKAVNPFAASPPNELPSFLHPKTKRKADAPMRKLMWTAIKPNSLKEASFWATVNEDRLCSTRLLSELQDRFASGTGAKAIKSANEKENIDGNHVASTKEKPSAKKKAKEPLVIKDGKVMQSLAILQGSAKLSFNEWKRALLEMDMNVLNESLIVQLRHALPPIETMKKLVDVGQSQYDEMPEGEQFACKVSSIKMLPARLDSISFLLNYDEMVAEMKPEIVAVMMACEEVRGSAGFAAFLELVLLVGNYMGSSVKNYKDTFAFEMNTLPKLSSTKDVENSMTLLHFLVLTMQRDRPENASFTERDFTHVQAASRVSSESLQKGCASMKSAVQKLENQLKTYQAQGESDRFVAVMQPFLEKAKAEYKLLDGMHTKMCSAYSELAEYYCFDKAKYGMDEFFGDLKTFKGQYEAATKQIQKERDAEEKKRRLREMKEKEQLAKRDKKPLLDVNQGDQKGLMDSLMDAIDSGAIFKSTPNKRTVPKGGQRPQYQDRKRSRVVAPTPELSVLNDENSQGQPSSPLNRRIRRKGQPTINVGPSTQMRQTADFQVLLGKELSAKMSNPFGDDDDDFGKVSSRYTKAPNANSTNKDEDSRYFYEKQVEESLQQSLASTKRSMKALEESETVGIATAEDLVAQGEKLRLADRRLDEINNTTVQTQRHLNNIKSVFGGIKNYFGRKPSGTQTKGDKSPDEAPPNALSSTVTNMKDSGDVYANSARQGSAATGERYKITPRQPLSNTSDRTLTDSSRNALAGTRWGVMDDEIEEGLESMSANLSRLKNLGEGLTQEIESQNDVLDRLGVKAEKADSVIRNQDKQMRHLLGDKPQAAAASADTPAPAGRFSGLSLWKK